MEKILRVLRDLTEERFYKENEEKPKSFEDLIKEVHEKGICGECGGCVSFCSAAEIVQTCESWL